MTLEIISLKANFLSMKFETVWSCLAVFFILILDASKTHLSRLFPELLCDSSHAVRMYMAEAIGIVFLKSKSKSLSIPEMPVVQDELFDIVTRCLSKSLVVQVS